MFDVILKCLRPIKRMQEKEILNWPFDTYCFWDIIHRPGEYIVIDPELLMKFVNSNIKSFNKFLSNDTLTEKFRKKS